MDIRITGTANLEQMRAQFKAMQREVEKLNADLAATMLLPGQRVNPQGFANMQRQMQRSSEVWRNAAASSGQFYTQQLKLNSATEQYTELLRRQKLTFADLRRNRKTLNDAYREQIALQNMIVKENRYGGGAGKSTYDVAIPKNLSAELDLARNRLGWMSAELASGSRQLVNWGKNTQWAGRQLMVGFTMPIAAFGAATGVLAYQVDKQLTRIQKVYDTTAQVIEGNAASEIAVTKELDRVREASMNTARNAAHEYGAAATDTLGVQAELAATGLKGSALQQATTESMRLATLGELDYQQAASTTIALQTAFKLSTTELTKAFNFMNATENATSLSIQDIAEATPRAASAMSALGVSVEEMTVLMASMKEAGVDAAEGANALKSATGTILAPSPAADAFIKQISNGRVQVSKLAEESGGNLYEALRLLYVQMEGLSDLQKQQIIVKLFGKYQFNRVSAMLTNLGDAFTGTQNQTAKAMELMGKDSKTLADTAETEMKRYQESVSGQFKRALEAAKIELSEMGVPFLKVATEVLDKVLAIVKAFNGLPEGVKNAAAVLAIITALIGPAIMLAGLFGNLIGNIGSGTAVLLKFISKFNILNKEQWATQKAADLARAGFIKESTAVEILTAQINALTASAQEARLAVGGLASTAAVPGAILGRAPSTNGTRSPQLVTNVAGLAAPVYGPQNAPMPPRPSTADVMNSAKGGSVYGPMTYAQTIAQALPARRQNGKLVADELRVRQATEQVEKRILQTTIQHGTAMADVWRLENAVRQANESTLTRKNAINTAEERGARLITATSVGTAAMTASMIAMVQPWSENVQAAGQYLMLLSLIVPSVGMLYKGMTAVGAVAKASMLTQIAAAKSTMTAVQGTTKLASATTMVRAGAKGAAVAFASMMGPVGWTVTAIAAIAGGLYLWNKHQKEIYENQVKAQKALNDSTAKWAQEAGKVVKEFERIQTASRVTFSGAGSNLYELTERYKSDDHKEEVDSFKGSNRQDVEAMNKYVSLQAQLGLTASEAAEHVQALYLASGKSFAEADSAAQELYDTLGDVTAKDWKIVLDANIDSMLEGSPFDGDFKGRAEKYAEFWSQAFADANTPEKAQAVMDQLNDTIMSAWQDVYDGLDKSSLAEAGVNSVEEFREKMLSDNVFASVFAGASKEAMMLEGEVTQAIAKYNLWGDEIKNLTDLQKQFVVTSKQWNGAEAQAYAQAIYDRMLNAIKMANMMPNDPVLQNLAASTKEQALFELKQIAINRHLKTSDNLTEQLVYILNNVKEETGGAADEADRLQENLKKNKSLSISITLEDAAGVIKSGMSAVQDKIADMASEDFNNRMEDAISAEEDLWEGRVDRLEDKQEKAMDRFDNRWERRKNDLTEFYEGRMDSIDAAIKAEEKAEETRQKIFQNEMDRLSRLNEAANRNIDFNVALNSGDFDEAAKIRNDSIATADQNALQSALDKMSNQSDARTERLNEQKDAIQDQLDAEMKALEKREEAERKHLEKVHEMRMDALKADSEAAVEATRNDWENRKDSLDDQLSLFKSYIARNQKDLDAWMKEVGISYDGFGDKVKKKGENWSEFFKRELSQNIRAAGLQVGSDRMWDGVGKDIALRMLRGMGFGTLRDFKKFVKTGELPSGFGKNKNPQVNSGSDVGAANPDRPGAPGFGIQTNHGGGWVGAGGSGRKGVARTNPIHPSERLVLAQNDEFIVNSRSSAKYGSLLEAMNDGTMENTLRRPNKARANTGEGIGGPGAGMAGVVSAMIGVGLARGIGMALSNYVTQNAFATSGGYMAGAAGMYSDRSFSAEQLRNAATIASVGSNMGMSPRDIMIGIMTAITESGLINIHGGHLDSQGLFQQRPSQGWGTVEQVTNPEYAARKFFEGLRNIVGRDGMSPWEAAQAVQRSAYSDGSNYRQYWDNAQAIFKNGLTSTENGYMVTAPGKGGLRKPSVPGKGWTNSHDYGNGTGSPLYAFNDGTVVESRAMKGGTSKYPGSTPGYYSYGETIVIRDAQGNEVRYAHLSPNQRFVRKNQPVSGGQLIGLSGWTGNATGPHTHFEVNGSYMAKEWFAANGIGLKTGGYTKTDGMANLHKNEVVVDPNRTKDLFNNMDKLTALMQAGWTYDPILTMFQNFVDSAGGTAGSGGATTLRTGTYNLRFDTPNAESKNDLTSLMKSADVLTLTEYTGAKRALGEWITQQGWGVSGGRGDGNDSAIIYDRAKYELLSEGVQKLNDAQKGARRGGRTYGDHYASYARLRDRNSGRSFWQIAAHTIAHTDEMAAARGVQKEQFAALNTLVERLNGTGDPVFLPGDLNPGPRGMAGINSIGLKSNWAGSNKNHLDHVLYNSLARLMGQRVVRGLSSDHNALLTQFQIPAFKEGGFIMSGGLARLHDDELVASKPITKDLIDGAKNFANGGNSEYNVQVNLNGTDLTVDQVTKAVFKAIKKSEDRKPGSRSE